ncbi:amidohydrolase [Phytoactinopolyspora halotolerans]|uniref:Amidohydrolase family protein n=1 Tax=Phytoactinopolyspora halotolerans TaxID=1981512 RepID=A0A6L9SGH3_9ACTN|nr:amidohydrolase family protein [Phytoactinopolyspora halotolerans]NEE04475.1 amidohydrolase family protein [Phytoactinopolyspora halotolerans]
MCDTPDLVLRDARPFGADGTRDVLLSGGRIAEIGPAGTLDGTGRDEIRLDGRFVGPGLWDCHVHFTQWVEQRRRFDLSGARSAAEALGLVRSALAESSLAEGESLTGYGFRDALWPDTPSLPDLDAVAPSVPVVLIGSDLHCAWLNTRAAELLEVEPPPSGLVRETEWIDALDRVRMRSTMPVDAYREAAEAAARRGVVGIVDFENADNATEWPARVSAGVRTLRVEASVWPDRLDDAIAAGLRTGMDLEPSGLVTMGPLKVVVDGSLNTRTALCWDPYPGLDPAAPHACGVSSVPVEELRALLQRAGANGIGAAVHAIGDRANTEVLDTFEDLGMTGAIEHAQLLREDDVARFATLGLVASVQPEHAMDDRDIAERYWHGRTGRAFPFASLHAAGATLRLGSDAPVAPLDPWQAIASATSRSRDNRAPWHPEQRLPIGVALAASSRGRSGVVVGDPADLVVVDRDPFACSPDELRRMPVTATLLAGRFTWCDFSIRRNS